MRDGEERREGRKRDGGITGIIPSPPWDSSTPPDSSINFVSLVKCKI